MPSSAPFVVARPRLSGLVARDGGVASPRLVLVTAPAGSGKTTLLAEMAARVRESGDEVAWSALSRDDVENGHFQARVLDALARCVRDPAAASRLGSLPVPSDPFDPGFVREAALPLRRAGLPVWLLVDDVHLVAGDEALAWLQHFASAVGPDLHVVVASRRDLAVEGARQLLDGSAVHLTGVDLALSVPEAGEALAAQGVQLDAVDVQDLHRRTEGWAAGLRLAALTLSGSDCPGAVLASLTGSTRQIGAYLVGEVLRGLPTATYDFLRATAAPRVLTVELAARLSGRDDAGAVLEQLLTDGQLIGRQDGTRPSYRYHALLRSHLLEEEAALDLSRYRRQRRTSAQHADDEGRPDEALEQAIAGQAWDLVVDLLERHGLAMVLRGETAGVSRALLAVPARHQTDRSVLLAAELALRRGDVAQAQERLAQTATRPGGPGDAETETLRVAVLLHADIMSGRPGKRFRDLLEPSGATLHSPEAMLLSSMRAIGLIEVDDPSSAVLELRRTQEFASAHGFDALALDCLSHLVLISWSEAGRAQTVALVDEAVEFATLRGWQATAPMATIYLIGAFAGFAMSDAALVDRYLAPAQALRGAAEPKVRAFLTLLPVYLKHAAHPSPGSLAPDLAEVWAGIDERVLRSPGLATMVLIELGLATEQEDLALAEVVAERAERRLAGRGDLQVVRATLAQLRGHPTQALALLDDLDTSLPTTPRGRVHAAVVRFSATTELGRDADAGRALLSAVRTAAERDLVEPLAVAPRPFLDRLQRSAGAFGAEAELVGRVLAAAAARAPQADERASATRLTRREVVILRELASLATLREIAEREGVSENTVKSHVKAIYDKLGVHNRRDALRASRQLDR